MPGKCPVSNHSQPPGMAHLNRCQKMSRLPYLSQGLDVPPSQPVVEGQLADYVGILVLGGTESRLVIELTHRDFSFSKIECWVPRFTCDLPAELRKKEAACGSSSGERHFQIWFSGVPQKKENFPREGHSCREVEVRVIKKIVEGEVPPVVR